MKNYDEALETWQKRCQYVLCDEYQDVNAVQDMIVTALSNGNTYSNVKFIDLESGTELAPEDFRTVSAK